MYFTLTEVADMLEVTFQNVHKYVVKKKLKTHRWRCERCFHQSKKYLVTEKELQKFIQYLRQSPRVSKADITDEEEMNELRLDPGETNEGKSSNPVGGT